MATNNRAKIIAEPGRQVIFIEREFDVPRDLVFEAYTNPKFYAQWMGPWGTTTTFEIFEPRSGGSWRYISKDTQGNEFAFHGVYHMVAPPDPMNPIGRVMIVGTLEFEGLAEKGHVGLETVRFEALLGRRTKVINQIVFQSVLDRDNMIQADMERGVVEGYERLDDLLERMKNSAE